MTALEELRQAAATLERRAEAAQDAANWLRKEADVAADLGEDYIDDGAVYAARLVNTGAGA